jgi:hypothetical protein
VRCIEWCCRLGVAGLALLAAGCSSTPSGSAGGIVVTTARGGTPTVPESSSTGTGQGAAVLHVRGPSVPLPAPKTMRSWDDVRVQAAERIVSANPAGTYMGAVPDALLAIPVVEIELNGDGSVRRIGVLRQPRQAHDTVQLAADAVRRAAPFGDVSRLPRPWKFTETFLFDDDRRFKPRTLD